VRRLNDTICIENGYSVVEKPGRRGKSYGKWQGDNAKSSQREILRGTIDAALARRPADLDFSASATRELKSHGGARPSG